MQRAPLHDGSCINVVKQHEVCEMCAVRSSIIIQARGCPKLRDAVSRQVSENTRSVHERSDGHKFGPFSTCNRFFMCLLMFGLNYGQALLGCWCSSFLRLLTHSRRLGHSPPASRGKNHAHIFSCYLSFLESTGDHLRQRQVQSPQPCHRLTFRL